MSLNLKKIRESGESLPEANNDDGHCLDHQLLKQLEDLVEKITTTGQPALDEVLMKQIKKICRIHDDYVEHTFHLVFTQLHKGHCEIRLSAFQVINELFNRSHHFRELLLTDMQEFLELCVETDPDDPLPPPKAAAQTLKESALKAIQEWQNKFGKAYKKMTLGYNFLKFQKKINFNDIEARSAVQRRRELERQNRRQLAEQQKVIKVLQKIQEKMPEIEESLTQMENCFELLLPHQTRSGDSDSPQQEEDDSDEEDEMVDDTNSDKRNSPMPKTIPGSTNSKTVAKGDSSRSDTNAKNNQIDNRTSGKKNKTQDVTMETNPEISISQSESNKNGGASEQNIAMVIKQEPQSPDDTNENFSLTPAAAAAAAAGIAVKKEPAASSQVETQEAPMETEDVGTDGESVLREHGLPTRDYNLTIRLDTDGLRLTETEDNVDILHTLEDHYKLITSRYLPEIALWMVTLGKTPQQQDKLKRCIDVKLALQAALQKYQELLVQRNQSYQLPNASSVELGDESSDSEDEFEDVPDKEGYEPVIPEHLREEYGLEPLEPTTATKPTTSRTKPSTFSKPPASRPKQKLSSASTHSGLVPSKGPKWHPLMETEHTLNDPASQAGTMAVLLEKAKKVTEERPQSSKDNTPVDPEKQKLLSQAPVVPFGLDLEHWEQPDNIQAPVMLRPDTDHLVWSSAYADEEVVLESVKSSMSTRVMSYAGSFKPVKWKCRAPLPTGKLCERMDRVKCPFHGKIIGRDKDGKPTNPEEAAEVMKKQAKEQPGASSSSPFDPELQRDVEAALGLDLGSSTPNLGSSSGQGRKGKGRGGKKGKGKVKKYPNLTDIKKVKNTSRLRLEKKILNKNAISRVANAMNSLEKKRHHDKFANNFNYAYSN